MKSTICPNRYFIECNCTDEKHILTFEIYEHIYFNEEKKREVFSREANISIQRTDVPFWLRLKFAFTYLFRKDNLSISNVIGIEFEPTGAYLRIGTERTRKL